MADPDPVTVEAMDGQLIAATRIGFGAKGKFAGLLMAFQNNPNLADSVSRGDTIIPPGRFAITTIPTFAPTTLAVGDLPATVRATTTGAKFNKNTRVTVQGVVVPTVFVDEDNVDFTMPVAAAGTKIIVIATDQVATNAANFVITA